ncbi:aldehyde dehydrogenase family protein [Aspergillus campestris IBT 28561]|uniref:aldehyde dehydrogenase (NAD(+)) n=1 Tax=Aspergillus campestris (strain IBT 28561) TaxID=1392248 RepID=A0A2I1D6J8_ASPC2|nr:aldehyde dehydrogenase family protein [Aspergillus campestris IBT 28561]PKY05473.1 aldehyde dehydrogenase family protein [Aspergillus campestris IBT 28561]
MSVETITTISPKTGRPIMSRTGITSEGLQQVTTDAQSAFQSYHTSTSLQTRQQIVARALDLLMQRKEELAYEITEQMGRPVAYSGVEIMTAVKRGRYLNEISGEVLGGDSGVVFDNKDEKCKGLVSREKEGEEGEDGVRKVIKKRAVGVVLAVVGWNYPYLVLINTLIPALLAGNAVIMKPSPQTPTVVEQVLGAFAEAGLPQNVLQYVHCGNPKLLEDLMRSPHVNHICFTGSVAGGLAVQQAASERIVNVGLELGGKDAAYVRPDVNVAWAAAEIVDGAIFNSGQSCCAIERVYVHKDIREQFIAEVKRVLSNYRVGDPFEKDTQIGPVVSSRAKEVIQRQIDEAVKGGALDETPDDNDSFKNMPPEGNFVRPTLLTGVTHEMAVMREETFGPVIPVMGVDGDEEALGLINDSEFGLSASVWTKDVAGAEKLIERIEAGTVFINRADYPAPDLAWTGWKNSGRSVTLSQFGFDQFVKLQSYHIRECP